MHIKLVLLISLASGYAFAAQQPASIIKRHNEGFNFTNMLKFAVLDTLQNDISPEEAQWRRDEQLRLMQAADAVTKAVKQTAEDTAKKTAAAASSNQPSLKSKL